MKSNSILNYYVPILHKDGTVINKDKDQAEWYTYDGLGRDLKYNEVMKNAEYQLKKGEYLLINYTDSKTSEDSNQEQKQVINKVYEEGTIIKANFPIIDSDIYHSNHSFSKKDGFNFENYSPAGMFTLGTDEQICIREPAFHSCRCPAKALLCHSQYFPSSGQALPQSELSRRLLYCRLCCTKRKPFLLCLFADKAL